MGRKRTLHLWGSRYPSGMEWLHRRFLPPDPDQCIWTQRSGYAMRVSDEDIAMKSRTCHSWNGRINVSRSVPSAMARGTTIGIWARIARFLNAGMRWWGVPRSIAKVV